MEGCPHAKDLDYWDSERLQDPFPLFKELRDAECPISKSEMHGGYYIASRWEDVAAIAHDFDTYISGKGISVPAFSEENGMFPQETDKPLHDEYRRAIAPIRSRIVSAGGLRSRDRSRRSCCGWASASPTGRRWPTRTPAGGRPGRMARPPRR